jgi:hypothetical protein
MSIKKKRTASGRDRRVFVRSERRDPPDVSKLSRALIALALAQARGEADAKAEHEQAREEPPRAA